MGTLLILGYGYTAQVLAQQLISRGWEVIATTRSRGFANEMQKHGVEPIIWPDAITEYLARATHILACAPPVNGRDPFLEACPEIRVSSAQWVGYLSSIGVYANIEKSGNAQVMETAPTLSGNTRGGLRRQAERDWSDTGLPLHIFRLAAIYGPGRGAFMEALTGPGRSVSDARRSTVVNRIHVDDIVRVLIASISRPNPGAVYNVCDDEPTPTEEVIKLANRILGAVDPRESGIEEAPTITGAAPVAVLSRPISNSRIKNELGVRLGFPNYRSGLPSALAKTLSAHENRNSCW